jgi:Fe-S-cluster containining protein
VGALPVIPDDTAPPAKAAAVVEGEVARALESLWEEARYRLFHPRRAFTWFSLRRRFDLRFIRPQEVKVLVPRGTIPDCESCTDICCTGPNAVVSLRLADVARLVDHGLDRFIVHDRPPPPPVKAMSWARYEMETSVFARMFPVLARDATGTCRLLDENLRCTAYPAWPVSCARYPYALDALRREVFLAKGCRSHRLVTLDDAPGSVVKLVDASVRAYNERIRDIILVHVALDELHELGLTRFLRLDGRLAKSLARLSSTAPPA